MPSSMDDDTVFVVFAMVTAFGLVCGELTAPPLNSGTLRELSSALPSES